MSTVELKHTWRVRRDAWFIRLYVYAWSVYSIVDRQKVGVSDRDITFCKLFWGYLLMPAAFLIFKPLFHTVDSLVWLGRRVPRRTAKLDTGTGASLDAFLSEPAPEPRRDPSRILTAVSEWFARVSVRVQAVWLRIRRPVLWCCFALAGLIAATSAAVIAYLAAGHLDLVVIGAGYGAVALAGAAIVVLIGVALERAGLWKALWLKLRRGGRKAKHGTLGFAGVMRIGYDAVKTNTCPRIELDDEATTTGGPTS